MLLLIDADQDASTGWYGYDYLVNKHVINSEKTELMRYNSSTKSWETVCQLDYCMNENKLALAIPRTILGLKGNAFSFDFKWSDNAADLNDPISLCVNGDTAPNRRFNYRCIWKK